MAKLCIWYGCMAAVLVTEDGITVESFMPLMFGATFFCR